VYLLKRDYKKWMGLVLQLLLYYNVLLYCVEVAPRTAYYITQYTRK
jgi:hypothetical protein